jgi:hypothetical protein
LGALTFRRLSISYSSPITESIIGIDGHIEGEHTNTDENADIEKPEFDTKLKSSSSIKSDPHYHSLDEPTDAQRRESMCGRVISTFFVLIKSPICWMLCSNFFLMCGPGLMVINNIGSMVQAFNDGIQDHPFTLNMVLSISICNGLGRLFVASSDFIYARRGWYLLLANFIMGITHFIGAQFIDSKQGKKK